MADTSDVSGEAAKAFVEAILKQSELLGSWALAVFGASILLIAWYVQRQLDQSNQPAIRGRFLIVLAILLQGISILLMYLAYGIMVNLIPELQFAKLDSAARFYTFIGSNRSFQEAQLLLRWQFWLFFAGIICLGIFGLCNAHLIRSPLAKK